MSKVDDELTRRFHRAERPVDVDGLFEGVERRRSHRERVRKVQASALAFAVLAGSVAGFVALRSVFLGDGRTTGDPGDPRPSNGEIVFVRDGADDRLHIYAARADGSGERQITSGPTNDSDPAVSPDGGMIAFTRPLDGDGGAVVATMPLAGGKVTWQTAALYDVSEPAWSPDGTRIAFVGYTRESADLSVAVVGTDQVFRIPLPFSEEDATQAHPTWSPDGTRIAFALGGDLVIIDAADGNDPTRLIETNETIESSPAWSPDGARIAFLRMPEGVLSPEEIEQSGGPNEIWTVSPNGADETLIAHSVEASLGVDLAWAPDGSTLLVSDQDWLYRVDPTPVGDVRDNFVQLFRGSSPSWQPIPAGAEPSVASNPGASVTASPAPEGRDIGLGVQMCDLEVLNGIDWDGTGIDGAAWTGAPVDEDGRCSTAPDVQHIVAVDRDGNGVADHGGTSTLRTCLLCRPFATVDLNSDGVLELVVLDEASSTPTYSLYVVNNPGSERAEGVYPIFVVPPGAPAMNLDANEPARVTVGGDEVFSGSIVCEEGGEGPPIVLRYTWVRGAVDADTDLEVDITRLYFGDDGVLHVDSLDSFSVPRDQGPDLTSTAPACGVDFHPAA